MDWRPTPPVWRHLGRAERAPPGRADLCQGRSPARRAPPPPTTTRCARPRAGLAENKDDPAAAVCGPQQGWPDDAYFAATWGGGDAGQTGPGRGTGHARPGNLGVLSTRSPTGARRRMSAVLAKFFRASFAVALGRHLTRSRREMSCQNRWRVHRGRPSRPTGSIMGGDVGELGASSPSPTASRRTSAGTGSSSTRLRQVRHRGHRGRAPSAWLPRGGGQFGGFVFSRLRPDHRGSPRCTHARLRQSQAAGRRSGFPAASAQLNTTAESPEA